MKKTSAAIFCALSLLLAGNAAWADALDEKSRSIVAISAYTARGDMDKLDASLVRGLEAGLTVNEIKEVLVQLYAYTGFPRSLNAIHRYMSNYQTRIEGLARGIPNLTQILQEYTQRLDDRVERLHMSFKNIVSTKQIQIEKNNLRKYLILNILEKNQENLKNLSFRLDSVSVF